MPHRRSLAEFEPLGPAERILIDRLDSGEFDRFGSGHVPEQGEDTVRIRADLLRLLLVGSADGPRLHEKGLRIRGAWIVGRLDLEGCRVPSDLGFIDCRFESAIILRSAQIPSLFLDGSVVPALLADRLDARGSIFMRATVVAGAVEMRGVRIGGEAVLDGIDIANPGSDALDGTSMSCRGDFQARGARIRGCLKLPSAQIGGDCGLAGAEISHPGATCLNAAGLGLGGDLILRAARLSGRADLTGLQAKGDVILDAAQITSTDGVSVALNRSVIAGALFMRDDMQVRGALNLNGAEIGVLVDAPDCWPASGDLALNRCVYGGILGAPVSAMVRLEWLALQDPTRWDDDFWPQPYEQLSAVLNAMGHNEEARAVLYEKEHRQRRARRRRAPHRLARAYQYVLDTLLRLTVGYGVRPLRALVWLLAIWGIGAALYAQTAREEELRPRAAFFLRSPEWVLCGFSPAEVIAMQALSTPQAGIAGEGESQFACFLRQPEAASLPPFNPYMYSVDAVIPGVESGQRGFWSPDTRSVIGSVAKTYEHFQIVAGWMLGLLAVAGFSGIVRSK